jgi:phenylacetic acid degradation operon negative regulatory protein
VKWDHKWRIIIFDIPHSKKAARDALRRKLIGLDCYPLQKSVWIHPFPCVSEISYVANVFDVNSFVDIFTVDDFDNAGALNHFHEILQEFLE